MKALSVRAHLATLGLIAAATIPTAAVNAQGGEDHSELRQQFVELGRQFTPKQIPSAAVMSGKKAPQGPNPFLSLLSPDQLADVDVGYWRLVAQARSERLADGRARRLQFEADELIVDEKEPDELRGGNDKQSTAQYIAGLGTGGSDTAQARILGTLAAGPPPFGFVTSEEDDGAIPLANDSRSRRGRSVFVEGEIGDGPYGGAGSDPSGDFDHFLVAGVVAGDEIVVDVDTPDPFGDLDPVVVVYDAAGVPVAFNDDDGQSFDSLLRFVAPADGDYIVAIEGFGSFQQDPFDSSSGTGPGSEGGYTAIIGINIGDTDFFSFDLAAGDVVSAKVEDAASLIQIYAPDGQLLMRSSQDASFAYPANTQLTGGGNALLDHVAAVDGRYALNITGATGNYAATVRVLRPGFEQARKSVQTIFLDFDGEELNTSIFGGPGVRTLSPLSAFLGRWGLTSADEEALVDVIVATTKENLRRDLRRQGTNPSTRIRVRNSADHRDTFGRSHVSRVIVGGTIIESGIETIGIAQSIDPGNYGRAESALVLLDTLSEPATGFGDPSLNNYLRGRSDKIEFIGRAIGNVVSHEVGHYVGNWHADQFNDVANLMDQGGNFPVLYGVGADRVGGTSDDVDVDFGVDVFNPFEGFSGFEDTLNRSAWAAG